MSALRQFRDRHGLTQAEAAALTGMSLGAWAAIERGFRARRPRLMLVRLLASLDLIAELGARWPYDPRESHET